MVTMGEDKRRYAMFERGMQVVVTAYEGRQVQRRVWEDAGDGVLVCSEEEYRRALRNKDEARAAGVSKHDVAEVVGNGRQEPR